MLTNPSQLLLRNESLFADKRVLVLNHEADHLATELHSVAAQITTLALDYNHYLLLKSRGSKLVISHFGHQLPERETFEKIIIYFPKAKALTGYLLALAAQYLESDGEIFVVGENKGGIKSLAKQVPAYFSSPIKLDSARHCVLFSMDLQESAPEFSMADWITRYQLATPQGDITICNLVGVFSQQQLDAGTQLLLQHFTDVEGRVLDFGCGAGVITAALLKAQPNLSLECVDINAMALASCELTLQANGMQAQVYASDGFSNIQGSLDAVISNPPFHDGLAATTTIAKQFVENSAAALTTGGVFQIVANRHLPYADVIEASFGQVNVVAENNKYKVYQNRV